jgi:hypothetical protein
MASGSGTYIDFARHLARALDPGLLISGPSEEIRCASEVTGDELRTGVPK